MSAHRRVVPRGMPPLSLLAALLLASPMGIMAQSAPATSGSISPMAMPGADRGGMSNMTMPASSTSTAKPVKKARIRKIGKKPAAVKPATTANDMSGMTGMDQMAMPVMSAEPARENHAAMANTQQPAATDTKHVGMPDMSTMSGTTVGPMQGGRPPANARSADYSDGYGNAPMKGMDMQDSVPLGMLLVDQLEALHGKDESGQAWEAEAWYGGDANKLWVRTEGERTRGKLDGGDLELLWNHTLTPYWDTQLGTRHDFGTGPARNWAAFGVQGLAPYWFEMEATGYVGDSGRTAARLRTEYELLFTQRLILQPEFEIDFYGQSDPARRIGNGFSDAQLGLRLRYEINRQFAPYFGMVWTQRFGGTADFARADRQAIFDRQWIAGIHFWF